MKQIYLSFLPMLTMSMKDHYEWLILL